ncbi:ATP-dependent DNA helicase PcrA, partial [bacterium]
MGDPDQSIYGWRGARIDNILNFEEDYPDATIIRLEQNYRSTKHILSAANSVIRKNLQRMEKDLWTENSDGMPVVFEESPDEYQEARAVIKKIKSLTAATDGLKYRDIAVFYRTNAQSRVFEEQLIREGMPYAIVGGTRFYDRKEIRDAIAYLMTVANPADAMSFQRVINTPSRHIGKAALDAIVAISAGRGLTLFEALKAASSEGVLQQKAKAREFINAIEIFKWAGTAPADANDSNSQHATGQVTSEKTLFSNSNTNNTKPELLSDRTLKLLENSGYMRMLQEEGTEEAFERIENLFELVSAIKDFETSNPDSGLNAFLDHVALISAIDSYEGQTDVLTLMTIHSAKGLEFKTVFIAGMEEGLFPLQGSRSSGDEDELEEERRLCYVGMTRAKESLFLHSARQRTVYGKLRYKERSRFIDEISHEHIKITGQSEVISQAKPFKRSSNE